MNEGEKRRVIGELTELFTSDPKELQKKLQAEHTEKCRRKMEPIIHLWRHGDNDWLKQRKADWKYLEAHNLTDERKVDLAKLKKYFLQGTKEEYIYEAKLFLFTPFESPDSAREAFECLFAHPRGKEVVLSDFLWQAPRAGAGMSWLRGSIQNFVEGVLGNEYAVVEANDGRHRVSISPEPTSWCFSYVRNALQVLEQDEYGPALDCFRYFLSALPHATRDPLREGIKLARALGVAEEKATAAAGHAQEMATLLQDNRSRILEAWNNPVPAQSEV